MYIRSLIQKVCYGLTTLALAASLSCKDDYEIRKISTSRGQVSGKITQRKPSLEKLLVEEEKVYRRKIMLRTKRKKIVPRHPIVIAGRIGVRPKKLIILDSSNPQLKRTVPDSGVQPSTKKPQLSSSNGTRPSKSTVPVPPVPVKKPPVSVRKLPLPIKKLPVPQLGSLYFKGDDSYFNGGQFYHMRKSDKRTDVVLNRSFPNLSPGRYQAIFDGKTVSEEKCAPVPYYLKGNVTPKCRSVSREVFPKRKCYFRIRKGQTTNVLLGEGSCKSK